MMHPDAFALLVATAASQRQVGELMPKRYSKTEICLERDRVTYWESDEELLEAWNGTEGTLPDWGENFRIKPNREGIHTGFADTVKDNLQTLIDMQADCKKSIKRFGHSQGVHCFVSTFYLRQQAHIQTAGVWGISCPPWALDENIVPNGVRITCGHDPVPCDRLLRFPCFHRLKRLPRKHLKGCPDGKKLCILDHDYIVNAYGMSLWCDKIGDTEGSRMMRTLMEVCNQQYRKLEGV